MGKINDSFGTFVDILLACMFMSAVLGALVILPFVWGLVTIEMCIEFVIRIFMKQAYEWQTGKEMTYTPWIIQKYKEA